MKKVFVLWYIFYFFIIIYLTGCETTPHSSTYKQLTPYKPKVKEVGVVEKSENPMEKYGRFTVELLPNGERAIYGGQFVPEESPPFLSNKLHAIYINYETKELMYYREGKPKIGYAVVTPSPNTLPKGMVRGIVTKIDRAPTWCPTPNIRRTMPYLPAGCLPYGHPLNAMGEVKFEIKWDVKGWDLIRLHGTEGYADNGRFWEIETFGCTRLQNDAIKNLVLKMGVSATKEGVEVFAYR